MNTLRYIIKKSLKQWLSGLVYVRDTYFMKFFPYKMRPLFPGKTRFLLSGNEIYESIKPENLTLKVGETYFRLTKTLHEDIFH